MKLCSRFILTAVLIFATKTAHAQYCPNPQNLVSNCGINRNVAGYTPPLPGDAILHVDGGIGVGFVGYMLVRDTEADSGADAEAETCVNLSASRAYILGASFSAINAGLCSVGWDEYLGPDCTLPNGQFRASPGMPPTGVPYITAKTLTADVQSVELAIQCTANIGPSASFYVDDVFVISDTVFADSF